MSFFERNDKKKYRNWKLMSVDEDIAFEAKEKKNKMRILGLMHVTVSSARIKAEAEISARREEFLPRRTSQIVSDR